MEYFNSNKHSIYSKQNCYGIMYLSKKKHYLEKNKTSKGKKNPHNLTIMLFMHS